VVSTKLVVFLAPKVNCIVIVGGSFVVACEQVKEHPETETAFVSINDALFEVMEVEAPAGQLKIVCFASLIEVIVILACVTGVVQAAGASRLFAYRILLTICASVASPFCLREIRTSDFLPARNDTKRTVIITVVTHSQKQPLIQEAQ